MTKAERNIPQLIKIWTLSSSVTLGSAVRVKGIFQEIRARLSPAAKKAVEMDGQDITLIMPAVEKLAFNAASTVIGKVIEDAVNLPIIPREIEDILGIKASERKRWIEDGRLKSAGTRTVRLKGRARKITFHVFEPKFIAELLDHGTIDEWREDDIANAAENRRRAAYKAKLTRELRKKAKTAKPAGNDQLTDLPDWDEFASDGFLR